MHIMTARIFFLLFQFLPFIFFAQDLQQVEDLRDDQDFFNQQIVIYQKWLDNTGLGTIMKVRELEVEEKQLTLYLESTFTDVAETQSAWVKAKEEFEQENPIKFEQQLFYKLANLMEVSQSIARLALYDTYDPYKKELFFRGIHFKNGQVQVDELNYKGKIEEIQVTINQKKLSVASFKKTFAKTEVFEKIIAFATPHFQRKTCKDRNPEIQIVENIEVLRFRATDLCREVLTDAANPLLGQILNTFGLDVNWVEREKLDILIAYEEITEGFKLTITIDGKYGSGLYNKVGRSGYYSMEGDFDAYLEAYANRFKELVRKAILE